MLCFRFHLSQDTFDFSFNFFFDPLVIQAHVVLSPHICEFSSFLLKIDFQFHTIVVGNDV